MIRGHAKGIVCICILILFASLIFFAFFDKKEIVLEFGMFAGSNWDVPNGDCYAIIDDAIERFEKKYSNVKIHYYSGI